MDYFIISPTTWVGSCCKTFLFHHPLCHDSRILLSRPNDPPKSFLSCKTILLEKANKTPRKRHMIINTTISQIVDKKRWKINISKGNIYTLGNLFYESLKNITSKFFSFFLFLFLSNEITSLTVISFNLHIYYHIKIKIA